MWISGNTGHLFQRNFKLTEAENFEEFIAGAVGKQVGLIDRTLTEMFTYRLMANHNITRLYHPRENSPFGKVVITGAPVVKEITVEPIIVKVESVDH